MTKNLRRSSQSAGRRQVNSFFAGVGGFELAFQQCDLAPAFYCEKNNFCRSVLARYWPEVQSSLDIRELKPKDVPEAEIWTAGFPCQDLSLARTPHGKRHGLQGSQSGLFHTFYDLLAVHKPTVVLLENVAGLLNSHRGADFSTVVGALAALGYAVAWRVLNARYFGVPQSRPRVFVCAWRGAPENAVNALYEGQIAPRPRDERSGFMTESIRPATGISVPRVAFCISATSGRHTGLDWARSYVIQAGRVRRLTPLECERLQGFPDNWTLPAPDSLVPTRGFESSRYHAIGNAVCVPVARWIAERISSTLGNDYLAPPRGTSTAGRLRQLADARIAPAAEALPLPGLGTAAKWQSGGIAYRNLYATAAVSPSPIVAAESLFIDHVEGQVDERYFLSSNAALGILRRVDKMNRRLFPPLDAALRESAGSGAKPLLAASREAHLIAI